jgi:hypothetical protein
LNILIINKGTTALSGGGMCYSASSAIVKNCDFINLCCNGVNVGGGWNYNIKSGHPHSFENVAFINCTGSYDGNKGNGGGIYTGGGDANLNGELTITCCSFTSCKGQQGGAICAVRGLDISVFFFFFFLNVFIIKLI